ncbi:ATPase [Niveispirillum lacus]|uniref:ATPase n=1 Tax=Niveispirillum lacus TaxID=1981099 RepID=A0A255YT27_9PROT|nr:BadF/BadG/BcrA/BcrD ATPase family protein [Niveispirillum lacus]OYQ32331.1 ATPase [Niveispirillum lacus]
MTSPLFLGIDGGGTRCRARLADAAGRTLGEAVGGAANIRLGLDVAWNAIMEAVDGALAKAELGRDVLSRTFIGLGLAGITNAADQQRVADSAPVAFAGILSDTDAYTACLGAHAGADGAILISGTGSAAQIILKGVGRGIGGWGFEVSDLGSGASMGREAVKAALLGHDGLGPHTDLTRAVMATLGGDPPAVVAWVGPARPGDYGTLAPLVLEHARKGDPVAERLVREQADYLVLHIRRLLELGAPAICLMGGLGPVLLDWMPPWVRGVLTEPKGDAMAGGVLLARRAGGA